MTINNFLQHFNGVKNIGNDKYMALCPAHNDHNPSLSIGYSDDKTRINLHCFAGCKTESILNSIGLTIKNLYVTGSVKISTAINRLYNVFSQIAITIHNIRQKNNNRAKGLFGKTMQSESGIKFQTHLRSM